MFFPEEVYMQGCYWEHEDVALPSSVLSEETKYRNTSRGTVLAGVSCKNGIPKKEMQLQV